MTFIEHEKQMYVVIKNDETGRPKFFVNNKGYNAVSGILREIKTEVKEIVPKDGDNAGKQVKVYNLVLDMVSTDGEFQVQIPLYTTLARSVMNSLAGPDPIDEVYLSVYNNKQNYRSISVRKSSQKEDYFTPKYTWDEEKAIIGSMPKKIDKGEEKTDWDKFTQKYIEELIPIINKKIDSKPITPVEITPQQPEEDNILPF